MISKFRKEFVNSMCEDAWLRPVYRDDMVCYGWLVVGFTTLFE
jgi:hypothetical protein